MSKMSCYITICLMLLGVHVANACPNDQSLFGPKKYVRTTGTPNIYRDCFPGYDGKVVLVIKNGDKNGKHRVTSALVFINGTQVFFPGDFKHGKYLMEVPIDLRKKNCILLELRSKPGTYLTIEITEHPEDHPTVSLEADPDIIFAGKSSILTWTSQSAHSCVIEPGIGEVDLNGSLSVAPSESTTYSITATGRGKTATAQTTITVITNHPPSISIVRPHDEGEDPADCGFTVQWVDEDEDDNAVISLYYDSDSNGGDGVLIAVGLAEDPDDEADRRNWDTTNIPEGLYYVYAVIDDDVNDPVISYSSGPIEIIHDNADETKIFAGDANGNDNFGKSVSINGDYAIVGADGDDPNGTDSGASYIFKRECNIWVEQAKLVSEDGEDQDRFGRSVSISGNYAIVGAYQNDGNGTDSGAAYIFIRNGEEWVQQARLTASDGAANDYFGYAVSISGEYAIVGAYQCHDSKGAAYIFKRDGNIWTEHAKLVADDLDECRRLGWSVHINGEYAAAGAPGDSENDIGSAFIYKRENEQWVEQAELEGDSPKFGHSVAVSESCAVVGVPRPEWDHDLSGEAFIFKHEQSSWTKQACLSSDDLMEKPLFGISVGIDDHQVVVGCYGISGGTAYIYETEDGLWALRQKFSDGMSNNTYHGYSVAVSGRHAIVGAYGDDQKNSNAGAAYIHDLESLAKNPSVALAEPDWTVNPRDCSFTLKWSDADADDNAEISFYYDDDNIGQDGTLIVGGIAEDPDADQNIYVWDTSEVKKGPINIYAVIEDGKNTKTTYARYPIHIHSLYESQKITVYDPEDNFTGRFASMSGDYAAIGGYGNNDTGEVQVFKRSGNTWSAHAILSAGEAEAGNRFGCSGAINREHIIIGAHQDEESALDGGAAYVFKYDGETWIKQSKLMAEDAQPGDHFGNYVSISGNFAIAGAWQDDDKGYDAGASYIFKRTGNAWTQQAKLTASDGIPWNNFGVCVCISNDYAFVSANGENYAGVVYVFKQDGDQWVQHQKLTPTDASAYGNFGSSISVSGDDAIIGSMKRSGQSGAYIFKKADGLWVEEVKLTTPDCPSFGSFASISKDYAVVSAGCSDPGEYFQYGASVFERDSGNWRIVAKLSAPEPDQYGFGNLVAVDGNSVMASAYGHDSDIAYIYEVGPGCISIDPLMVSLEKSTILSWSFPSALSVVIDNGIGEVPLEGSMAVTVSEPTVFTATARGCWGTAVSSATVTIEEPTASIAADPTAINLGGSSTLSWTATNATSCVIEPGIGSVEVNGSISVSPTQTTTYTITATGPGGMATATATVSIAKPTVILNADPASILIGNAATLTWSSTNALSCEIQPGIGSVGASGSVSVSPTETTTYTITATGPGGSASANATVTVLHLPTISINTAPRVIHIGESATLTWSSQYADSCTIDQGIGSVAPNSSMIVSPSQTTTYTIKASGPGGEASSSVTATVIPLAIYITSPDNGNTLNRQDVMVKGTIVNPSGIEVGVTVNGVLALVHGDEFVASHVPLEEGQSTITAVATDTDGNSVIASIAVLMEFDEDFVQLTAEPDSGVAPFETTLSADGSFTFTAQTPGYTGPGVVEFLDSPKAKKFNVRITTPGIYYFTVETLFEGKIYMDTTAVQVMDQSALDALLRAKWNAMRTALSLNELDRAANFFDDSTKNAFRNAFSSLSALQRVELADELDNVMFIKLMKNTVEYDIRIFENSEEFSYYLLFIKSDDGIWKIKSF